MPKEVAHRLPETVRPERYTIELRPDLSRFTFRGEESVAIRVLQGDYVPTRLAGKWQNDFRVSIGVVFRFHYTEGR